MSKIFLSLLICLSYCGSLHAQEVNSDLKSYCGPEDVQSTQFREKLSPWFGEIDKSIRSQSSYSKVTNDLLLQLPNDKLIICWLSLGSDGVIKEASLNTTTGFEATDKSILKLIQNLSPIKPPNSLAYPEKVLVEFRKRDSSIEISSQLNTRFVRGRIGQ